MVLLSESLNLSQMRCVGAAHPPCVRCLKSNRECVVRLPNRQQRRGSSVRSATSGPRTVPPSTKSPRPSRPLLVADHTFPDSIESAIEPLESDEYRGQCSQWPSSRAGNLLGSSSPDQKDLPSIFSLSPITIAVSKEEEHTPQINTLESFLNRSGSREISDSTIYDLVDL